MTRAIHRNLFKDETNTIGFPLSDHLRNHVHLTNCIHLKNHMHRHSPILTERSLMRDLIMMQRSRSLRDPSASPSSWTSPLVSDISRRKQAKDGLVHSGRRYVGVDRRREVRAGRLSVSSARAPSVASSKVANVEDKQNDDDIIQKVSEDAGEIQKRKGKNVFVNTLSDSLDDTSSQTDNGHRQPINKQRKYNAEDDVREEHETSGHGNFTGLKRMKQRQHRFRNSRRASGIHNESHIDSHRKNTEREHRERDVDMDVCQVPRNGCGIPWNWSRIHHRGKTFLDRAGRSLSCGLSDPRLRKAERSLPCTQTGTTSRLPIASDQLISSTDSDSEALPLLIEPPGSQDSNADCFLVRDYSGELGIYANKSSSRELESEARTNSHCRSRNVNSRHRTLTQKYMPRTFKDLVGQNLVVQALSNAVLRTKVGLVYVFYGPNGSGKTSCARVFAKALNCQSLDHPKPCDVCTSCISHNLGKSQNVVEVGPVSSFDYESMMDDVLDKAFLSPHSSQYRVFIVDDCDTLPPDSWSAISKVIDRAPRRVVFILIGLTLDHMPHIIISRCQKFFFPKLKDSDITYVLQWIATSEGLHVDKDALKLIASRSDGSLRDAVMTLDQLSLLGQRISLPLVQELVGLVPDEKLVDLLDLVLSADTVNTVKNLREIMESGVEPLALMSQLATIITDILAGSYVFTHDNLRSKFFRRLTLSKEDMEKLRLALKTLSEAEKQLRMSNDKLTWLTAALLQLAPDQQYTLPTSAHTSSHHSPLIVYNSNSERDQPKNFVNECDDMLSNDRGLSRQTGLGNHCSIERNGVELYTNNTISNNQNRKRNIGIYCERPLTPVGANNGHRVRRPKNQKDLENMWRLVLENIPLDNLKQFLYQEGKLSSVSFGIAPTVQLVFSTPANKSKAEKYWGQISRAFESTLMSKVILEMKCDSRRNDSHLRENPRSSSYAGSDDLMKAFGPSQGKHGTSEITELTVSPNEHIENGLVRSQSRIDEQVRRQSLVRGKVSLAHVIQQAEAQNAVWSRRKAISIAEKLEQENLRLEPRSRSLLCWRVPGVRRRKLPLLKVRTQKPRYLLKIVTCGQCLS